MANLPHLHGIAFDTDPEIWVYAIRQKWEKLNVEQRRTVLEAASAISGSPIPVVGGERDDADEGVDIRAADALKDFLGSLDKCEYVTFDLSQWRERATELLADDRSARTVLLFDQDYSREKPGTEREGPKLIREAQKTGVGYVGLLTHTVQPESEYAAWSQLADDHDVIRDRFVVIAKGRLSRDSPDYYGFLGMLRLVALSGRYADVKSAVWSVFKESVDAARAEVEHLSVLDFDRIVFGSSRREGAWELDTLLRVFSILMRRSSRAKLYQNDGISGAFAEARRVSNMPEEIASAFRDESSSIEALRIHRFETYESADGLNRYYVPIELGDIFEKVSNGKRYILLAQSCDLMVRSDGRRAYDDKLARTGALAQILVDPGSDTVKESWGELPFYDEGTGRTAFVDFAKVHQVQLAALDLCALCIDGVARIKVDAECPELLIEPWKERYKRLCRFFNAAIERYGELSNKRVGNELRKLALPVASATVPVAATVEGKTVQYDLKRVMRLKSPWSGALLTSFAQFQSRAAFGHSFDDRIPKELEGE